MLSLLPTLLAPPLVVIVVSFMVYRFGFFSGRDIAGRYAFVWGGALLFLAVGWEVAELASDYHDWFVLTAYPIINLFQFAIGAVGLLLMAVGLALYADFWQSRRDETEERFGKLSIQEHLHHDARHPYHLLELLNISLREILIHYPLAAGAILLVNRTKRQFVLTCSSGLKKEEVAHLEYYPLERNIVSQAVELGDPMLTSGLDLGGQSDRQVRSRFHSVLILPLTSGLEKIGGLLLFAEEPQFFGREDIRCLMPVAHWLSERIRAARLERELNRAEKQRSRSADDLESLLARIDRSTGAASASDATAVFCRSLVGLAQSESVHLCGLSQGTLVFFGNSEPLFDLTENLRAALIDGLARAKPLVINQETVDDGDSPVVVRSSLVYPLGSQSDSDALLLVKSGQPFAIDDHDRREIQSFANLAGLVLRQEEHQRLRLGRRKGFEAVLKLLQAEGLTGESDDSLTYFTETLSAALPRQSLCAAFALGSEGRFGLVAPAPDTQDSSDDDLNIRSDEGGVGRAAADRRCLFIHGRGEVSRHLETYDDQNRSVFQHLFGERGIPRFLAYCPLVRGRTVTAVILVAIYALEAAERGEWERLLTLAAGLCSLRLAMSRVSHEAPESPGSPAGLKTAAGFVNELNNHLSGVIGIAELSAKRNDIQPDLRVHLGRIIDKAQQAANLARRSLQTDHREAKQVLPRADRLNQVVEAELESQHVSGDLYMAGQRPREVKLNLGQTGLIAFSGESIRELFQSVLNRFAAMADEEDVITIATYLQAGFVYLDLSRHRRNFPPVEPVAGFGRYLPASEAYRNRPGDVFLRHLTESESYFAVDSSGAVPAFLSFKFPLDSARAAEPESAQRPEIKLLAIDDQAVILDLISAMGQSLGYTVHTAATGEEGVRMADRELYDVVLTDLALPGMSGLQVAQHIRRTRPEVPIILVTGWTTEMSRAEQDAAGITEVLYKPFRIEQLTAIVRSVVSGQFRP